MAVLVYLSHQKQPGQAPQDRQNTIFSFGAAKFLNGGGLMLPEHLFTPDYKRAFTGILVEPAAPGMLPNSNFRIKIEYYPDVPGGLGKIMQFRHGIEQGLLTDTELSSGMGTPIIDYYGTKASLHYFHVIFDLPSALAGKFQKLCNAIGNGISNAFELVREGAGDDIGALLFHMSDAPRKQK